jgi:hypothetical protein
MSISQPRGPVCQNCKRPYRHRVERDGLLLCCDCALRVDRGESLAPQVGQSVVVPLGGRQLDARSQGGWLRPETLRAVKLPKRKPTESDRPPASTFPGRKPKLVRGQLDLEGGEHDPAA